MSPRHRPPTGLRALVAAVGIVAVGFTAALMLSDRAPGLTRRIGGGIAVRVSERLDAGSRAARLATDPRLPAGDTLVHIGLWGTVMLLVGLAVWSWRGLLIGSAAVLAGSVVVEAGQSRYTTTRTFQAGDLVANAVGVAAGAAAATGCYLVWSGVARLVGAERASPDG